MRLSPQRRLLSLRPSSGIFWMLLSAALFLLGAARFGVLGIAHCVTVQGHAVMGAVAAIALIAAFMG